MFRTLSLNNYLPRPFLLHVYNDGGCSSKEAPKLSNLRRRKPPPTLEQDSELDIEEKDRSILAQNSEHVEKEEKPHSDEHQIKLDTDRSFVLYSLGKVCGISPVGSWLMLPANYRRRNHE